VFHQVFIDNWQFRLVRMSNSVPSYICLDMFVEGLVNNVLLCISRQKDILGVICLDMFVEGLIKRYYCNDGSYLGK
jgi:hypothetical protein